MPVDGGGQGINDYLLNFKSSEWADMANKQLQAALNQGLQYSEKYNQQASNALQNYNQQARTDLNQGLAQAQALDAPRRLATYGALDAYQGLLGLPTPQGGSFQLAQAMNNQATGQPVLPQQQPMITGFNQGLLNRSTM